MDIQCLETQEAVISIRYHGLRNAEREDKTHMA